MGNSALSKLTKEELAQYKAEFEAVDKDKSGSLSRAELVEAFGRCGASHCDALADAFMSQHDSNKDGSEYF
jgi:Ca2+-binding EF-hand superfamily protein